MRKKVSLTLFYLISIGMIISSALTAGGSLQAQWLEGYSHRAKITIDESLVPGTAPLTGFPFLFSYSDTLIRSVENGGYVSFSNGMDICFTNQDGITHLDYEIESYNPETGFLSSWIRIPSLSAETNTDLFLYYGNPDAVPSADTAGVWSNNYTTVWHMQDDPSEDEPQITDATAFANHGTTGGNMDETNQAEGKIAGAIYFDGDENFATMPVSGFNTGEGSVELWVHLDSISDSGSDYFFAHRQEEPTADRVYLRVWPNGEWGTGMGNSYDLARGDTLQIDSWHHMALTWDDTIVYGFLDGALDFGPVSFTGLDTVREIYVMAWMPSSESASGVLDELRVSSIARDSAWLMASYQNQFQPESGYAVETQFINDFPCNAIELEITDSCTFSINSNLGAGDSGLADPGCGNYEGGDIWFYVEVPESGSFSIQTDTEATGKFPDNDGWMFRTSMALYQGACNDLTLIGCYQNNSIFHPRMAGAFVEGYTPGDTIRVRIWANFNNDNGNFRICVFEMEDCPSLFEVAGGGSYCQGDSGVSVTLSGSETGISYILSRNDTIVIDTLSGNGSQLNWSPLKDAGIYRIIANDTTSGCTRTMNDSVEVIVLPAPEMDFQVVSISCFEFDDGNITAIVSGGTTPYQLSWSGPDNFSSTSEVLQDLSPGIYQLTVSDSNSCLSVNPEIEITEPELLQVSLEQVNHLSAYEANDGSVDISISGGTVPYIVSWTGTDDFTSSETDPSEMTVGYYRVHVTDDHLCMDSVEMIMVALEPGADGVFIPEGFSPNGDGYNDYFVILGLENYPENELRIFNRQGVEIYHSENYLNDWDGRPEKGGVIGGQLPEGTYYYLFSYGETGIRKGFLYLNRE